MTQAAIASHATRVTNSLRGAGFEPAVFVVPEGEQSKSLGEAERLWDGFLAHGMDRHSPVVAVGGGVVGDLAGFAGSAFMRGLPVVQVPTTLLAQVDASVGGKVAVNHPRGKNLIGAFHQPRLVLIDPEALRTLPDREYRSGLAEIAKTGAALDAELFRALERIRVYTKEPGKKPDLGKPFVLPAGATVSALAELVHHDVAAHLKFARIWGHARFEGQQVDRHHVLADRDVVELHA